MKLGIVGSGMIVREFLPKLVKLDGLEVVGVQGTPRSKEQTRELCAANGVANAASSFEELTALDIDTVYIAVPNFLHFMYCKRALEAGLNVIVEKPIASNFNEAEELGRLARRTGRFLFEAVTTLYFDGFQKIKEWIGRIGAVKIAHCNYSQYSSRYDAFRAGALPPVFDPAKSGGALMDLNLYNLHFIMGLFGKPESAVYYANIERHIDTSGTMILRYPGFVAACTAAKDCSAPYSFVIEGTNGYITTQYPPNFIGEVKIYLNNKTEEIYNDGMAMDRVIPEFRFFMDCIKRNDLKFCFDRLNESIAVSEIQTKARLDAGIIFAADQKALPEA